LCARRKLIVLGGWIIALMLLAGLTVKLGSGFTDSAQIPNSESATAYSLLDNVGHGGLVSSNSSVSGNIAWHVTGTSVTSPEIGKDVAAMLGKVAHLPGVESVASPYGRRGPGQPVRRHRLRESDPG
jgi:RND superfamily putative drug exporter